MCFYLLKCLNKCIYDTKKIGLMTFVIIKNGLFCLSTSSNRRMQLLITKFSQSIILAFQKCLSIS